MIEKIAVFTALYACRRAFSMMTHASEYNRLYSCDNPLSLLSDISLATFYLFRMLTFSCKDSFFIVKTK